MTDAPPQSDFEVTTPYIKRPDLRPEELPGRATPEQLAAWRYWIEGLDLHTDLKDSGLDPLEAITALDLTEYPHIHGKPDPVKIISFFCACHEWKVYPPAWIMDELYQRFNAYLIGNGTGKDRRRLGEFFGEPARGNRGPWFRQQAFAPVMQNMCTAIDRLRYVFNLSIDNAVGIVATHLDDVVNKTGHRFDKGEAALAKYYKNEWGAEMSLQQKQMFADRPPTYEQNKTFLRQFNEDALAPYPHLKTYLKD